MAALICQACGRPIGSAPAVIAPGPRDTAWWMHRDLADCAQALGLQAKKARKAA